MSYDPDFPQENTIADAPKMGAQLLALKTLAENAPAGPPGPPGPPGPGTIVSMTGTIVDNTDPANPVIRTDVIGGAPKLVEGDRVPAGAANHFLGADVSGSNGFADPNAFVDGDDNPGDNYANSGFYNRLGVGLWPGNSPESRAL